MKGYERFKDYLQRNGFPIVDEDDHSICFKFQGTSFFAWKHNSSYLQLVCILNTSEIDRDTLLETCNKMNENLFVTKFVVLGEKDFRVWCYYEFLPDDNTTDEMYFNAIQAVDRHSDQFFKELKGE